MDIFNIEPSVGSFSDPTKATVQRGWFFMSFFSHIGQLVQIVLIFLCCYSQQETKLYFIDLSLLFSGLCVHKWGRKLESTQGIKKIHVIFCFITFFQT